MSWTSISSETLTLVNATDDRLPHVYTLAGVNGSQLAIVASSASAKPTWRLACQFYILAELANFPGSPQLAQVHQQRILLARKTLVEVPEGIVQPFQLRLEIPYWFREMSIQIWQRSEIADEHQTLTVGAAGQTEFQLVFSPALPQETELYINGVKATYGLDYAIEGNRLTYLDSMVLEPSDKIEITYDPS
ncbi:hypothetical protein H6F67_14080 [Microcoleus sp. FACHB-1515]|uniref:hypothetical protein n=1 Tax=Cyanophyceae TaxID=3028117 RepID=UPI001688650B|nr:hypothetical protein [Microcoleus sp. FACHB-1515]MBD2090980.1 hypothetical protein [Microcoleus sp. FACHB-1515]